MLSKRIISQFWDRVQKTDSCWLWTGHRHESGYGLISVLPETKKARHIRAHRVSWEIHNGPIPDGLIICHHCDNPPCVNPDHLFLGTYKDNVQDMIQKGRQGDCAPRPERARTAKLNWDIVAQIRERYKNGEESRVLSREFGVNKQSISMIILGQTWKLSNQP